ISHSLPIAANPTLCSSGSRESWGRVPFRREEETRNKSLLPRRTHSRGSDCGPHDSSKKSILRMPSVCSSATEQCSSLVHAGRANHPMSDKCCQLNRRHHTSVLCAAENPIRFPWAINTTFEEK